MKASELILLLTKKIEESGDLNVCFADNKYGNILVAEVNAGDYCYMSGKTEQVFVID